MNLLYGLHYHNLELVRNLIHETRDLLHQSVHTAFVSSLQTVLLLKFNYTVKQNKNKIKSNKIPLTWTVDYRGSFINVTEVNTQKKIIYDRTYAFSEERST